MDVIGFLRRFPPFDGLDAEQLARVAAGAREESFPAGAVILEQAGEPAGSLYVVREGSVEVIADGRVLDLMGEGEVFGHLSLVTGLVPTATIRAHEDTRCLVLDRAAAREVLRAPGVTSYVASTARRRIAPVSEGPRVTAGPDAVRVEVGSLVRRPPVACEAEATVGEAANRMAEERVSSILVRRDNEWGIMTDRDLRGRVLASGLGSQTPVGLVATFPARIVPAGALAAEALSLMMNGGFHHLPVVDEAGRVRGVVDESDLIGTGRHSPLALSARIEAAPDLESVLAAARGLSGMVATLVDASFDAVDVGHVLGITVDSLTRRLLDLAIEEAGEPPVPWAWLAFGSLARHEQALHTDQDHALAYDPQGRSVDDLDPLFERIAGSVTSGLERAGLPPCRAGIVASNRGLRRSLDQWASAFRAWMGMSKWEATGAAAIVFDYRRVAGPLEVESVLDEVVGSAHDDPGFLKRMAKNALDNRPPTGFFQDFVVEAGGTHAGELDVKHGGIMPITDLARTLALAVGTRSKRTLDRLEAARRADLLDEEARTGLEEAFRLLWQTRLEHQVACVRSGQVPDDFVDPTSLGPVARMALKEAFRVIGRAQKMLRGERWLAAR